VLPVSPLELMSENEGGGSRESSLLGLSRHGGRLAARLPDCLHHETFHGMNTVRREKERKEVGGIRSVISSFRTSGASIRLRLLPSRLLHLASHSGLRASSSLWTIPNLAKTEVEVEAGPFLEKTQ